MRALPATLPGKWPLGAKGADVACSVHAFMAPRRL